MGADATGADSIAIMPHRAPLIFTLMAGPKPASALPSCLAVIGADAAGADGIAIMPRRAPLIFTLMAGPKPASASPICAGLARGNCALSATVRASQSVRPIRAGRGRAQLVRTPC